MKTLRRLSLAALGVAYLHLVFGAIVRITGSGMGCGDHWPKCYDHWFPPLDQPTLIIEWSHRLLAFTLFLVLAALAIVAWRKRGVPGVSGRGGVLRTSLAAPVLWIAPALLGALTVFLGNPPGATVAHWIVAMLLVAVITANAIRAGALGGHSARLQQGTARAMRSSRAAAVMALLAVAMGGLTAKVPFGAVACRGFPLCDAHPDAGSAVHVQMTHRALAFFLFFHLIGVVMMMRRRPEAPVVRRAGWLAFGLVTLQLVVAASMILMHLPPVLRSMHEAVGVAIWIGTFAFAYLARLAARNGSPAPAELMPVARAPEAIVPVAAPVAPSVAPVVTPSVAPAITPDSAAPVAPVDEAEEPPVRAAAIRAQIVHAAAIELPEIEGTEFPDYEPTIPEVSDFAATDFAEVEATAVGIPEFAASEFAEVEAVAVEADIQDVIESTSNEVAELEAATAEFEVATAEFKVPTAELEVATAELEVHTAELEVANAEFDLAKPAPIQSRDEEIPIVSSEAPIMTAPTPELQTPVIAPPRSPSPPHTIAVIVARGADL